MPTKGNRDIPRSPRRQELMPSRQISRKRLGKKGRKREKKKGAQPDDRLCSSVCYKEPGNDVPCSLLHLSYDGLECLGVIDSEVSKNLAVDLDATLVQQTHQLRVAQTLEAGSSVDTLDPQSAEVALLVTAVTEGVGETLLPSVLGNGPNVLAGTKITSGQTQDFISLSS